MLIMKYNYRGYEIVTTSNFVSGMLTITNKDLKGWVFQNMDVLKEYVDKHIIELNKKRKLEGKTHG